MHLINKIGILLVFTGLSFDVSAQEIKIAEFRSDPRDISARENTIYDANGDPCSLIKARCGLGGVDFESDLGIRKVERKEGEYWIWVPPGTRRLNIALNDSVNYDFELPEFTEEYKVYVFVVTVILPTRIEYKDIPELSFNSKPSGAKIYLNDIFYGNTPLNVSYNYDTLQIRAELKTYETVNSEAVYKSQNQEFNFDLKKDPLATRFFILLSVDPANYEILNPGITFGLLGKTGFYISLRPGIIEPNYSGKSIAEYSDTSSYFLSAFTDSREILRKFEIFGGLSKRVFSNVFFSVGMGYWEYFKYQKLTYNTSIQQDQDLIYKIIKVVPRGIPRNAGVTFDFQLYCRVWNKILLNVQTSLFQHLDYVYSRFGYAGVISANHSLDADVKIGVGYSF